MITHVEPDILEGEVRWASGNITMNKASEGDGIPVEVFQILKFDAVKSAVRNMPATLETQQVQRTGKGQFSFQSQRKSKTNNAPTTAQLHSSHSKVMLKILQARL